MTARDANLDQIQRWMQSVIMHPGGVSQGVQSAEARQHLDVPADDLESVIRRSRALASSARLEIYVDAYFERLLECLREEFPVTRGAVGTELFDALAFGYLQHHPSTSYTLARLGAAFPGYLDVSRLHAQAMPADAPQTWVDGVVELARLERVQREVFDAPGSEDGALLDMARLNETPAEQRGELRVVVAPCLRLCSFSHPVHEYWLATKQDQQPAMPAPRATLLAINRRDFVVERHELTSVQFALVEALVAGKKLAEAIAQGAEQSGGAADAFARGLSEWFAQWTRQGFFVDLNP